MSLHPLDSLPPLVGLLSPAAYLAAGVVCGALYFEGLWLSVRRFAGGERVTTVIALAIGRFALLGGLLTLVSREGALPLLMMALGLLIARSVFMRSIRETAP